MKKAADCPQLFWTVFVARQWVEMLPAEQAWTITKIGKNALRRQQAGGAHGGSASRGAARAREDQNSSVPLVDDKESPLAWLAKRKDRNGKAMISAQQFAAGERLRYDYHRANLNPHVTMNWSVTAHVSGGRRSAKSADALELTDAALRARNRVTAALQAVGSDLANILIDVCCHLKGLEYSEKHAGWPRRSGKVILGIALTALARHYGLLAETDVQTRRHPAQVKHWGEAGYRPAMDAAKDYQ